MRKDHRIIRERSKLELTKKSVIVSVGKELYSYRKIMHSSICLVCD